MHGQGEKFLVPRVTERGRLNGGEIGVKGAENNLRRRLLSAKGRACRHGVRRRRLVSVGGSATKGVIHKVTRILYNRDKECN